MQILDRIYINNLCSFCLKFSFESNISKDDICKFTQNRFLKDVPLSWCSYKTNVVIPSYRHKIMWNNSNIKAGSNTLVFANWYRNGLKFLKTYMMTQQRKYNHIVHY